MRLIDKDATLGRIEEMKDTAWYCVNADDVVGVVTEAQEVDPVHAAGGCYCRECRIRTGRETQGTVWCGYHNCSMRKDDFCSMGKREETKDG